MFASSLCPECEEELSNGRNRCLCGWFNVSKSESFPEVDESKSQFRCRGIDKDKRCDKDGTVSRKIKGNYWYCKKHSQEI